MILGTYLLLRNKKRRYIIAWIIAFVVEYKLIKNYLNSKKDKEESEKKIKKLNKQD